MIYVAIKNRIQLVFMVRYHTILAVRFSCDTLNISQLLRPKDGSQDILSVSFYPNQDQRLQSEKIFLSFTYQFLNILNEV